MGSFGSAYGGVGFGEIRAELSVSINTNNFLTG
jgi:hypothetical protein